jgi:hypothetical protein
LSRGRAIAAPTPGPAAKKTAAPPRTPPTAIIDADLVRALLAAPTAKLARPDRVLSRLEKAVR